MEIMLQWRICQVLSKKYFSPAQPQTLPSAMMEATEPNMLWEGEQKWPHFNNSSGHDLRAEVGQQFQGVSHALLFHQMKSHVQLQCTKHMNAQHYKCSYILIQHIFTKCFLVTRLRRRRNSGEELPRVGGQGQRLGGATPCPQAWGQGRRPRGATPRPRSHGCVGAAGPRGAIPR